jgi:hypothetical protein
MATLSHLAVRARMFEILVEPYVECRITVTEARERNPMWTLVDLETGMLFAVAEYSTGPGQTLEGTELMDCVTRFDLIEALQKAAT